MGKTLILIDGHALAFRQYFALERTNMKTSDGTPTWAVYGFFKAIFDLLKNKELKADAIGVAFDVSHQTFRTETYSEYKSNRQAMPDPMRVQMSLIYEGLKAFNIPIYTKEGFEADDVIGTISKKACELGHKVLILTGDQDAFQLVDEKGCVKVILPYKGELIEYNWDKIYEKLGVYPNQVIDYKALRGDVSDCIPGVKGIGEKTAQKLLAKYKNLDAILADCENIPEKSVREKLCNGVEQAKMSQFLATIVRDLDVDFNFEHTKIEIPEISIVTEFLKKMQFYTFIKNINNILYSFDKVERTQNTEKPQTGAVQLGFFTETVSEELNKNDKIRNESNLINNSKDLSNLIENLNNLQALAFKIHSDTKSAVTSNIIGISFAYCDNITYENGLKFSNEDIIKCFYIPLKHSNAEKQLNTEDTLNILKPIFENENIKKFTHDVKTQINVLKNQGINLKSVVFDTFLASYVKDSNRNHNLDIQVFELLQHSIIPYAEFDKKNPVKFEDAPFENALRFACDEIASIIKLTKFWIEELSEKELEIVYNIEVPLAYVLAQMEYNGVTIDEEYLISLTENMNEKLREFEGQIYNLAKCSFNINSPKQVSEVLFVKMGLKAKKKRGGKANFSTSAAVLEELAQEYDIARLILDYRKFAKLKSTYTEALPALIDTKDYRVHTTFNQTGTVTGRLSSSNPNLQNIPIRTKEGNLIRNAFIPQDKDNGLILSADYSQIELRILAHITQDKHLLDAFNKGIDVHTITASKVFEVPVEKVTKEMRYKAKAVNFGIIYGQTKYGLAKALGITKEEAEDFIKKYFALYPKVKAYMEGTITQVEQHGYVETIFGRKRYLEAELQNSNAMVREFAKRAAINQPMQGSAADLIKIAMIDFSKKLQEHNLKSKMIIQVHDEIVVEVYKPELEQIKILVKEAMELNQPLSVPLEIDINVGETWKEQ